MARRAGRLVVPIEEAGFVRSSGEEGAMKEPSAERDARTVHGIVPPTTRDRLRLARERVRVLCVRTRIRTGGSAGTGGSGGGTELGGGPAGPG